MGDGSTATAAAARCPGSAQRWFFTVHALQRMHEMAVLRSDVLVALNEPEVAYPACGDRRMAVRGHIAVVSAGDLVVTVLWHTTEVYHRADTTFHPLSLASRTRGQSRPQRSTPERKYSDDSAA